LQHVANANQTPRHVLRRLTLSEIKVGNRSLRRRSRKAAEKLERSLDRFGLVAPIICDRDHRLIDGHARLRHAKERGSTHIDAIVLQDDPSPAELKALGIALNRLPEDAEWDREALADTLSTILELDGDFDLNLTGFEIPEIDIMLDEAGSRGQHDAIDDEIADPPRRPVAHPGDVFALGPHMIACGDARDADLTDRLLEGVPGITMVFTDPPYNVPVSGHVSGLGRVRHREFPMATGEMTAEAFTAFLTETLGPATARCRDGAVVFVCMDWRHVTELTAAARQLRLEQINLCVWVKPNGGMGSFYRSRHELILVFKVGTASHLNNVDLGRHGRYRTNVWEYDGVNHFSRSRRDDLSLHPTVKPVAMVEDAIKDCTRRGDVIFDGFLGSGSTLLAADRTGRVCRGVELDPGYVDLAIERWQALTGSEAIHGPTGLTFRQLRARRHRRLAQAVGG